MTLPHRDALIRLIYMSRAAASGRQQAQDVRDVLAVSQRNNPPLDMTGVLMLCNGFYFQVIEGPRTLAVELYRKLRLDPRHRDIVLLSVDRIDERVFPHWSMGLVQRSEPESVTQARAKHLRSMLERDSRIDSSIMQIMFAPALPGPGHGGREVPIPQLRVALVSPRSIWSAAVLEHVAASTMVRLGRTHVLTPDQTHERITLEYLDINAPQVGPLRVLALNRDPQACPPVAAMLDGVSLLVFVLSPSIMGEFLGQVSQWLNLPHVRHARPRIAVLTGQSADVHRGIVEAIAQVAGCEVSGHPVKLSDPAAVWSAVLALAAETVLERGSRAAARLPARVPVGTPETIAGALLLRDRPPPESGDAAAHVHASRCPNQTLAQAPEARRCLESLLSLPGATEAALIDVVESCVIVSQRRDGAASEFERDTAFLWITDRTASHLDDARSPQEVAVHTSSRTQIFLSFRLRPSVFLGLLLQREQAVYASVRREMMAQEALLAQCLEPAGA